MIDILMATYDGEKFLREQLDSVRAQTFGDWRLIVSDDGSHDATLSIAQDYARRDPRIVVGVNDGHLGHGANANFYSLLRKSNAPYAMFCDQDDVWMPNKVELTLARMRELEKGRPGTAAMVFTDLEPVDEHLVPLGPSFWEYASIDPRRCGLTQVCVSPVAAGCTTMLNAPLRELALRTGDVSGMVVYDWWVTMVAAGLGTVGFVDAPTSLYRQHGTNSVGADERSNLRTLATWRQAAVGMRRYLRQAQAFYDVYGDLLPQPQRRQIQSFIGLESAPRWRRLGLLAQSGAWKTGTFRQVGQALVVLAMSMGSKA